MQEQSLLEQAKAYDGRKFSRFTEITDDLIELAIAWAADEVKDSAVRQVIANGSQCYPTLARALREAVRRGKLKRG